MGSSHRLLAILTLLGWLFAAGHVALEHASVADGGAHHALFGGTDEDDHDDDGPAQDGEHHHHEFSTLSTVQWMKSAERTMLVPLWVPLFDVVVKQFADVLREGRKPRLLRTREHAPPDERDSGWLLICRTAHPVRGPSLVV